MMPNFQIKPKGLIEWVSAMQSQNRQASHFEMPKCSHVFVLITLTPEPLSIIQPATSCPCRTNLMAGLWWSTTVGLSLVSVNLQRHLCQVCLLCAPLQLGGILELVAGVFPLLVWFHSLPVLAIWDLMSSSNGPNWFADSRRMRSVLTICFFNPCLGRLM